MKKMKRLVAVLLAGILALAMLTACGETTPTLGQRAENLMIESFNKAYNANYQNDETLKNKTSAILNKIDENGQINVADLKMSTYVGLPCEVVRNADDTGTFIVYVVAQGYGADKTKYQAIEVTEETLSKAATSSVPSQSSQKPEAIGVASVVKNGKTYIGVAYKMTVKVNWD